MSWKTKPDRASAAPRSPRRRAPAPCEGADAACLAAFTFGSAPKGGQRKKSKRNSFVAASYAGGVPSLDPAFR
eukprot:4539471-Alexandrium_andersonii.AAC.1